MLRGKNNVLYSLEVPTQAGSYVLSSLNQTAGQAGSEVARDQRFISMCVTLGHDGGFGGTSGQVGSEQGLITQLLIFHKNPETKQHPRSCFGPWIHPSRVRLIKTDPGRRRCTAHRFVVQWTNSQIWGLLSAKWFVYVSLCKGNKHILSSHKWITHSLSTKYRPRTISSKGLNGIGRADAISGAQLDMTWSNDFMLSVKYTGRKKKKKINAAWQHYIKSLCVLIFLFCLCTFVWGVASRSRGPGGAELARTMWESEEAKPLHMSLFFFFLSPQFLLWLQNRRHLYRPFHPATSSITADKSDCTFNTNPRREPRILLRWRRSRTED